MKKYGVDENPELTQKEASEEKHCPICGAVCEQHGQVYICPVHGSKPFESQND